MAERGKSDIDRFLAEIERLRKKSQGSSPPPPPPKAKPKPVVAKAVDVKPQKARRIESPPPTVPIAQPSYDEAPLPKAVTVAVPITPPGSVRIAAREQAPPPPAITRPQEAGQAIRKGNTAFGRQLSQLLTGPQTMPMAIVLSEIFGPPKSRCG